MKESKSKRAWQIPSAINRRLGRAMHDYQMLEDGDRVLLAVSGGVDSLVLAWILSIWQQKAPITYSLEAVTIDHGYWREVPQGIDPAVSIGNQLDRLGIKHSVESAWDLATEELTCYQCARNRRSQLFEMARQRGFNKIGLGHHKDDLIETFFLNILYSGNISTMVPKQELFEGRLSLLRPMAYLEKHEVLTIAAENNLSPVPNYCPLSDETQREKVRNILESMYEQVPDAKRSIFASLTNVRKGYLP